MDSGSCRSHRPAFYLVLGSLNGPRPAPQLSHGPLLLSPQAPGPFSVPVSSMAPTPPFSTFLRSALGQPPPEPPQNCWDGFIHLSPNPGFIQHKDSRPQMGLGFADFGVSEEHGGWLSPWSSTQEARGQRMEPGLESGNCAPPPAQRGPGWESPAAGERVAGERWRYSVALSPSLLQLCSLFFFGGGALRTVTAAAWSQR